MFSISRFDRSQLGDVAVLWRALHPQWRWLEDEAACSEVFESSEAAERIGFVVRRHGTVIASVFGMCGRNHSSPRTRRLRIDTQPADIAADWLEPILAGFADTDRGERDAWHTTSVKTSLSALLAPLLEAAGFARHSSELRLEWRGNAVTATDPGGLRLERYAGGNHDLDAAIVDLHNRTYLPSRFVLPVGISDLWTSWPGLDAHEFVLAQDNDRLVAYTEWSVTDGEAWISDLVAARSHWGTGAAAAAGTKAVQILLERGHRHIKSVVRSTNAASLQPQRTFGWTVAAELSHTFVRRL